MSLKGIEISKGALAQLRQKQMASWIIWGNLNISLVVLTFVAHQMASKTMPVTATNDISSQIYLFPWIGALLLFISRVVYTRFTSDERIKKIAKNVTPSAQTRRPNTEISTHEQAALRAVQSTIQGMIISLALSEAASILGFILAIQSKQLSYMIPFVVASFMLNALNRPPTNSAWERALSAALQTR